MSRMAFRFGDFPTPLPHHANDRRAAPHPPRDGGNLRDHTIIPVALGPRALSGTAHDRHTESS